MTLVYQSKLEKAEQKVTRNLVVFAEPELRTPTRVVPLELGDTLRGKDWKWEGFPALVGRYIPIIRWGKVYAVDHGTRDTSYVAPDVRYETNSGTGRPDATRLVQPLTFLSAFLVGLAVFLAIRHKSSFKYGLLAAALLRCASLIWTIALFGFFTIHAHDETHYFQIAQKLLLWGSAFGEYPYTVGNPMLYLPFLIPMDSYSEVACIGILGIGYFIIFGIGILGCYLWILRNFANSPGAGLIGAMTLAAFPWLVRVYHGPNGVFSYFGLWLEHPLDLAYMDTYYYTDFVGYNAMSDSPAIFFGLLGLIVLYRQANTGKTLLIAGLLLGFSCIIRIAGIFYLLPAGYLLIKSSEKWSKSMFVTLIAGFSIALVPQLVWNGLIFGNPLTLGYEFRTADFRGFEIGNVRNGIMLYGRAFQQLMAISALALFIGRKRFRFASAFLALMILPTLVFYTGYHAIGQNPVRFILLPLTAMISAIAILIGSTPDDKSRSRWTMIAIIAAALTIPGTNFIAYLIPVPGWFTPVLFITLAILSWSVSRAGEYSVFFIVLAIGYPPITYGALVLTCSWIIGIELISLGRDKGFFDKFNGLKRLPIHG